MRVAFAPLSNLTVTTVPFINSSAIHLSSLERFLYFPGLFSGSLTQLTMPTRNVSLRSSSPISSQFSLSFPRSFFFKDALFSKVVHLLAIWTLLTKNVENLWPWSWASWPPSSVQVGTVGALCSMIWCCTSHHSQALPPTWAVAPAAISLKACACLYYPERSSWLPPASAPFTVIVSLCAFRLKSIRKLSKDSSSSCLFLLNFQTQMCYILLWPVAKQLLALVLPS